VAILILAVYLGVGFVSAMKVFQRPTIFKPLMATENTLSFFFMMLFLWPIVFLVNRSLFTGVRLNLPGYERNASQQNIPNRVPAATPQDAETDTGDECCEVCFSKDGLRECDANHSRIVLCAKHDNLRTTMPRAQFDRIIMLMAEASREYSPEGDPKRFTSLVMEIINTPGFDDCWWGGFISKRPNKTPKTAE